MNATDLQKLRRGFEISQKHDSPPEINYWTLFELIALAEKAAERAVSPAGEHPGCTELRRQDHEQALKVTHALMAERDHWKAKAEERYVDGNKVGELAIEVWETCRMQNEPAPANSVLGRYVISEIIKEWRDKSQPSAAQQAPSISVEEAAKAIYRLLPGDSQGRPADYPWQEGGNSNMQELARRMAYAALAAPQPSDNLQQASTAQAQPVAWGNLKEETGSVVPFKTREEAQASVDRSYVACSQEGPYRVVPLIIAKPSAALAEAQATPEGCISVQDLIAKHEQDPRKKAALDRVRERRAAPESGQDERAAFEVWARDPVRSEKLPLDRWPSNDGYKDTRTYIAFYGWKSGRAALAAQNQPEVNNNDGSQPSMSDKKAAEPVAYIAQISGKSHKSLVWAKGVEGYEYIPLYRAEPPQQVDESGLPG